MPVAVDSVLRNAWEDAVARVGADGAAVRRLRATLRAHPPVDLTGTPDAQLDDATRFAVLTARVAFADPAETIAVYDQLADAWLGGTPLGFDGAPIDAATQARLAHPAELPAELATPFWSVIERDVDPATITADIAAFGAAYDATHRDRCAHAMHAHAGWRELAAKTPMPRTRLDALEECKTETLGDTFRHLILDNGFDLEVLDPDSVGDYHPEIDPVSRRILQTHEIWHLVCGYSTSALHEVAISGFQLAQFGHNYSRDFLATVATKVPFSTPALAPVLIQVILEGWRHGRDTQPLMLVDWHDRWNDSIESIRADLAIIPFESIIPDLPPPPG